jgi:hypothetical protein
VIAVIDNLAELKVVLYILRHTWGFHEFKKPVRIKTDEFMHGRFLKDGTRMDAGTGLSKSSVLEGLERAKKHGFIECFIDDRDKARVKCYYRLKVQNDGPSEPEPPTRYFEQEDAYPGNLEPHYPHAEETTEETDQREPSSPEQEYPEDYDPYANTIFSKNYQPQEQKIFAPEPELITTGQGVDNHIAGANKTPRSHKRINLTNSLTKDIRKVGAAKNLEEALRYLPDPEQLPKPKPKALAFIRNYISDFSQDLGDTEHIPSNISQAHRLYLSSGMTEEAFTQALYNARATAKRATQVRHMNSNGGINRMPYFFKCLSGALKSQEMAI